MRNLLIPASLAILAATTSFASAATSHKTTGMVKSYDGAAMTLALNNGSMFHLPKTFKNPGLKTGEKVQVSWQKIKGSDVAQKVMIVK